MKKRNCKKTILTILNLILSILPAFFWVFLIFGFEDPHIAYISISAAVIHESGHILCILLQKRSLILRSVFSGLRINQSKTMSYDKELITYACGPVMNLIAFIFFSFIAPMTNEMVWDIAIINLATGLSNLLPVEGYDGYGIIRAMIYRYEKSEVYLTTLKRLSSVIIFGFCIFSLYLIDRMGGGYWIFGVFFISTIKCIKDDLEKQKTRL